MGLFIFRFWPVLIPLFVYWLWHARAHRLAKKEGKPLPHFREGPWYWAVLASLVTGIGCYIYIAATTPAVTGEYVPPHLEHGEVVPGQVER